MFYRVLFKSNAKEQMSKDGCIYFGIRRQQGSWQRKSKSAWFPPRLGSITTPNIARHVDFYRSADFAVSVQDLSQKLGSNAFQKQ